ncbi:MAG: hypothetical protein AB7S44_03805 [Spirochaetales bacterium]
MELYLRESLIKIKKDLTQYLGDKNKDKTTEQIVHGILINRAISNIIELDKTNLTPGWIGDKLVSINEKMQKCLIYDESKSFALPKVLSLSPLSVYEITEISLVNGEAERILLGFSANLSSKNTPENERN